MSFTEDIKVRPHFCSPPPPQSLAPQRGNCKMDQEMLLRVLCTVFISEELQNLYQRHLHV